MAIKIYEQFAPFANPADGDYPQGSFKNDSIPGAEDGTPLDAVWANDYTGFDAELFAQAGIVPSGQPDKLGSSQRVEAIKLLEKEASKVTKSGGGSVQDFIDNTDQVYTRTFANVDTMLAFNGLVVGQSVKTLGYYDANDGGGAEYLISDTSNFASILLSGGKYANIIGSKITTRQMGLFAGSVVNPTINNYIWLPQVNHVVVEDALKAVKIGTGVTEIAQVNMKADCTLEFLDGASLTMQGNTEDYYRMISIEGGRGRLWTADASVPDPKINVKIINPVLYGDRDSVIGAGEYGNGILIYNAENVVVTNPTCYDMFGDGIGIGADAGRVCKNIQILGKSHNERCRRQGISVGACEDLYIEYLYAKDIDGTAPFSAIDFETNNELSWLKNCHVGRIYAENCYRALLVARTGASGATISVGEIETNQYGYTGKYYGEIEIHNLAGYDASVTVGSLVSRGATNKNILYFWDTGAGHNFTLGECKVIDFNKTEYSHKTSLVLYENHVGPITSPELISTGMINMIEPRYTLNSLDFVHMNLTGEADPDEFNNVKIPITNPANRDSNGTYLKNTRYKNSIIGGFNFERPAANLNNYTAGDKIILDNPKTGHRYNTSVFDMIIVNNPKGNQFYINYAYYQDYTLSTTYAYVTQLVPNLLYNITGFTGYITMNHTAKTISFHKVTIV